MDQTNERKLPERQLLSVREVAAITGFGVSTIWRKVQKGAIPEPMKLAGSTRWRRTDIEALISAKAA